MRLWETDCQLHTAAVPSRSGNRLVSLHHSALHLHDLHSCTVTEQVLLKSAWALSIPDNLDSENIDSFCEPTWAPDDKAIAAVFTVFDFS